ncbi:MAG: hypothetical protein GWP10_15400, partial [Nitrospiraceae bacterium]|nr:hypothetical protein [Nitrospiraceae bacterium]
MKRKEIIMLLIFALLFSIYFYISYYLFFGQHYIHPNLIFFAEKALIATKGYPPRLENIGFVYPPLAFIPFLVFNNPIVVPALVSALLSVLFIIKHENAELLDVISIILILFNPLYLFLATQRFDVLLFYYVFLFSIFYILKHIQTQYSIYAFLGGVLLGITFFIDFRSIFVVPLIVLAIYVEAKGTLPYKLSVITVVLTPIVFFLFSWIYLNWIFTGDPFTFIKSPYSFFHINTAPVYANSLFDSLKYTMKFLISSLPLTFPYYLLMPALRRFRLLYSVPLFLIYLSPIFLLFFSVYFNVFFPNYYTAILLLLFAVMFSIHMNVESKIKKIMLFGFALSFLFSFVLPIHSKDLNESNFVKVLLGKNVNNKIKYDKAFKTAEILKAIKCQNILTDDA